MVTTLLIPRVLQMHCGGKSELLLQASTVGALLTELRREYPSLYVCVCDETGRMRQHLHLFLNDELLNMRDGRDARLKRGDTVSLFQAVSGG